LSAGDGGDGISCCLFELNLSVDPLSLWSCRLNARGYRKRTAIVTEPVSEKGWVVKTPLIRYGCVKTRMHASSVLHRSITACCNDLLVLQDKFDNRKNNA
jgi:hypothetical protein